MRQRWLRLLLPVASLLLLAYLGANALVANRGGAGAPDPSGKADQGRPPDRPRVGEPLPDFTLPTLDGGRVTRRDLLGKPAFINFWASWCGPCRSEMPDIDAVARAGEGKVRVLAVNEQEPAAVARSFMQENGYSLRVALDQDGTLFGGWDFRFLPTSIFVDPQGVVCSIFEGTVDRETMQRELARAAVKGCEGA